MDSRGAWWGRVSTRPRLALAAKAALAAGLAWLAVAPLGVDEAYRYYAPFGAVVAVTSTLAQSLLGASRVVAAIVAGMLVTAAVRLLPTPAVVSIGVVVAAGTLVGGARWFADKGSWVPISALVVLVVGGSDPQHYVTGYLGLTTLGAVVGVLVNVVLPPLPLSASGLTLQHLRTVLADQVEDLAGGLGQAGPPTAEEWGRRRRRLDPHVEEMRRLVLQAADARRGNWRARRWQETGDRQYEQARTLERLSGLVEELVDLVVERECAEVTEVALGRELRPVTAGALEALAGVLRTQPDQRRWRSACVLLEERLQELRSATRRGWREGAEDRFTAAALVVDLERATRSLRAASAGEGRL